MMKGKMFYVSIWVVIFGVLGRTNISFSMLALEPTVSESVDEAGNVEYTKFLVLTSMKEIYILTYLDFTCSSWAYRRKVDNGLWCTRH